LPNIYQPLPEILRYLNVGNSKSLRSESCAALWLSMQLGLRLHQCRCTALYSEDGRD